MGFCQHQQVEEARKTQPDCIRQQLSIFIMAPKEMGILDEAHTMQPHLHDGCIQSAVTYPSTTPMLVNSQSLDIKPVEQEIMRSKKRLRWSTVTVHEFGVGLGGSSVPSKGGPSIGLSDVPEFTWSTNVGDMAKGSDGIRRFTSEERIRLLQSAGVSDGMILRFSRETNIILSSRKRTLVEDKEERRAEKKRKAQALSSSKRSCSSFVSRPRMIPQCMNI